MVKSPARKKTGMMIDTMIKIETMSNKPSDRWGFLLIASSKGHKESKHSMLIRNWHHLFGNSLNQKVPL